MRKQKKIEQEGDRKRFQVRKCFLERKYSLAIIARGEGNTKNKRGMRVKEGINE